MARHPLGQAVRLTVTVRDLAGALATPTTLTLTVRAPDGTDTSYASPTVVSTGVYRQDVPTSGLASVGHYSYKWVATGPGAGVPDWGDFDVFDPLEAADNVLSLADAKQHLNIPAATTAHDDELRFFLAATTTVVERLAGAAGPRTVTEKVRQRGGGRSVVLATRPVLSVTSLTPVNGGAAYDVSALYVDSPLAGIVRRSDGGAITGGPWTAVYRAGRAEVPANIGLAARVLVQHLWETQRGSSLAARRLDVSGEEVFPGMWFAVPNKVKELLEGESVSLVAY